MHRYRALWHGFTINTLQRYRALMVFLQLAWFYNKYNVEI